MKRAWLIVWCLGWVLSATWISWAEEAIPMPEGKVVRVRPDGSFEARFEAGHAIASGDVYILLQDGEGVGECVIQSAGRQEVIAAPRRAIRPPARIGDGLLFLRHPDAADARHDLWHAFTPPTGSFTIMAPPLYRMSVKRGEAVGDQRADVVEYVFVDREDGQLYVVVYFDLPMAVPDPEPVLDRACDRFGKDGERVLGKHAIRKGGLSGREVDLQSAKGQNGRARLFLSGQRIFYIMAFTARKSMSASSYRFLDSFEPRPPRVRKATMHQGRRPNG